MSVRVRDTWRRAHTSRERDRVTERERERRIGRGEERGSEKGKPTRRGRAGERER